MFSLDRNLRYWLYCKPTDMRKSFHTLSGVVRNKMGCNPMDGDVYIFVNKSNKIQKMTSEQQIIAEQAAEIERLRSKVASLEDQLYWLRKKMFGKMSEKNLPLDPTALMEPTLFDDPLTSDERAELEAAVKKDEEDADKLIQVKAFERKPRKAIDTANLEVREEHIYPEVENREEYTELDPEVTDTLVLVPARMYVRRIGKAIKYTLPLLPRLGRYVNDGRFCIDNNLIENAIRPLALGRKNYLFCGNHDAAIRAAIVYSLVDTCKAVGKDPREWMEDILFRIPGNENHREGLRDLLPDKWAKPN